MTFGDENDHGVADEKVSRELFDALWKRVVTSLIPRTIIPEGKAKIIWESSSLPRRKGIGLSLQQNTALTCARTTRIAEETVAKVWCIRSMRASSGCEANTLTCCGFICGIR